MGLGILGRHGLSVLIGGSCFLFGLVFSGNSKPRRGLTLITPCEASNASEAWGKQKNKTAPQKRHLRSLTTSRRNGTTTSDTHSRALLGGNDTKILSQRHKATELFIKITRENLSPLGEKRHGSTLRLLVTSPLPEVFLHQRFVADFELFQRLANCKF